MPRLPRIHIEGSLYYITCNSHHSNELFKDNQDYNKYLSLLITYKDKYQFKLFSYCLLSNKVYLLVGIKSESSISDFMFNLNSSYTKYYNTRHGKKGHVLGGRFKSKWIEKKTYLLPLTRYIHLLAFGKNSPCSSHPNFLGRPSNEMLHIPMSDEIQEVFSCLPQQTDYKTYVEKVTRKELKDLEQKLSRNRFLGSKEFQETVKTALKVYQEDKENKVEIQDEKVKPVNADLAGEIVLRRHMPAKLLLGSLSLALLLLLLAGYFYNRQSFFKKELSITKEKFNQELTELNRTQIQPSLQTGGQIAEEPQNLLSENKEKAVSHPLEGIVCEIKLGPASSKISQENKTDILTFKEGKFISNILRKEGFSPSKYSMRYKGEGVIVWETMQTKEDGTTVNWYGELKGNTMKGVLSERVATGKSQDSSFVSIKYSREG